MSGVEIALGLGLLLSLGGNVWLAVMAARPRDEKPKSTLRHYTVHLDGSKYFADVDETVIKKMVQDKLQEATEHAAERFSAALDKTVPKLAADIEQMNSQTLQKEFEKYQIALGDLNDQAVETQTKLHREVEERRASLLAAVDAKIVAEYKERMAQFEARLDSVVTSHILETLQEPADLGAQMPFILAELNKRKEQIKQDVMA